MNNAGQQNTAEKEKDIFTAMTFLAKICSCLYVTINTTRFVHHLPFVMQSKESLKYH